MFDLDDDEDYLTTIITVTIMLTVMTMRKSKIFGVYPSN